MTETTDRARWGWRWLVWCLAIACSAAASWAAVPVIAFFEGPDCNHVATNSNRVHGLLGLVMAFGIISIPWIVVLAESRRHRLRLLIGWILGIALLVAFIVSHLTVRSWDTLGGGFCF